MKVHYVKCMKKYFEDIICGKKRFEIRLNDRKYEVGDTLILREWENGEYSGNKISRNIDYILHTGERYGLMKGYSILQLAENCVNYNLFDTVGANSDVKTLNCP